MNRRDVQVTSHAIKQARDRRLYPYGSDTITAITADVTDAIAARRVLDYKPGAFNLFRARDFNPKAKPKNRKLGPGQRFVHNEDMTRGFIIAREEGRDVVITSLSRARAVA